MVSLLLISISVSGCNREETNPGTFTQAYDSIPPVVNILGNKSDTTCLHFTYMDPGATVSDFLNGGIRCSDVLADVTGRVNTEVPGVYFLKYSAVDVAGNTADTVTRTVHVVENRAGFLTGIYNVVCTCTATIRGTAIPTVTTENYIAAVSSERRNGSFTLSALRIGPEKVSPSTFLSGNSIQVFYYFSPADYHSSSLSGTLSATKNTFTIETKILKWTPSITYACRNVYTNSKVDN